MSEVFSYQQFKNSALPLWSIITAQQLVLLPLYFFIPVWIGFFNLSIVILLIFSKRYQLFKLTSWFKVFITLISILGVLLSFEQYTGRDAGVALISVMYGLKILELNKKRDAYLLLNLGFFMLVAGFLFSQKPWIAFYQFLPIIAILNALIAINSLPNRNASANAKMAIKQSQIRLKNVLKNLIGYLLLALPIMLILFLFFPRLNGPLWRMPGSSSSSTGVSDTMSPGDISSLKLSDEIAFRVQFNGNEPQANQLYWRTIVLNQYDGISWSRENSEIINIPKISQIEQNQNANIFDYALTIEPTNQKYLVTLDKPVTLPNQANLSTDYVVKSNYQINERTRYQLQSITNLALDINLSAKQKLELVSLPGTGNSKSRQWALNHRQLYDNDWDYIVAILTQINQQEYFYTLSPPIMDEDMVDSFWFDHKKGFCEHYAGVLVFLARAANIPARVVIGYQGGDKNPLSNYWIIRDANAHAWTEIWIEQKGWIRVDPTSAIAPFRVEQTLLQDYRQRNSLFDNFDFVELGDVSIFKRFGYWQDQFNNRWNDWILDYNDQKQKRLFEHFGFSAIKTQQMIIIMIVLVFVFILIMSLQWIKNKPKESPLALAYINLLKQLERRSIIDYQVNLGPLDLKNKLSLLDPIKYNNLIVLLEQYINLRYRLSEASQTQEKKLIIDFKKVKISQ